MAAAAAAANGASKAAEGAIKFWATPGCPYVLKVLIFLTDANLMDAVNRIEDSPAERAYVTEKLGKRAQFPAIELPSGEIIAFPDVDGIVNHLAKLHNIDISQLYVYNHYIEGVFPRYRALLGNVIKQAHGWPNAFPSIGIKRIIVLGATGMAGSRIVQEAKLRGHFVTGVSRSSELQVDANSAETVQAAIEKVDPQVLIVAMGPSRNNPDAPPLKNSYEAILSACRATNTRVFFVGGAGCLRTEEGGPMLMETPGFPDFVKPEAQGHADALDYLRTVDDVTWTYCSPAPMLSPGEKTGKYKTGGDFVLGRSISAEDYACAVLDEIADPKHDKQRFHVAN